jgi:hypothetical protein
VSFLWLTGEGEAALSRAGDLLKAAEGALFDELPTDVVTAAQQVLTEIVASTQPESPLLS